MTYSIVDAREIDQTVWKWNRNGNWSVLTIKAIGNSTVKCSDGNTYNLKPGEETGDLRGEKFGASITTVNKNKDIEYQEKMQLKKIAFNIVKNTIKESTIDSLTIDQLSAIQAILNSKN